MKRFFVAKAALLRVVVLGGFAAFVPIRLHAKQEHGGNPIIVENRREGSNLWMLPWQGYKIADDIGLQIKGFAERTTTHPGGDVALKVTVNTPQNFQVDILRLGWYGGVGARHMKRIEKVRGFPQEACTTESGTRMISCNWKNTVEFDVPKNWLSGVYVAVVTSADRFQSLMPFWVVDNDRHSDLLFISSLNTYEAYNAFPYDPPATDPFGAPRTGRSLYPFSSAGGQASVKVSFDRPFSSQYGNNGNGGVFDFEPETIAFLEKSGYDVTYAPDPAIDRNPGMLLDHKAIVIGGHAEYWSKAMYDGAIAARAAGVGLAFISANEIYWQVRYESNSHGLNHRVVVGYKDTEADPIADPTLRTIKWRDLGRPEQKLIGIQYPPDGNQYWGGQPYLPQHTDHWAYAGTGFRDGVSLPVEAVGYEMDNFDTTVGLPEGTEYTLLAASPFLNFAGVPYIHNSSIYRGTGGNWVWATGSMTWAWTLAPGGTSTGQDNVRSETQFMTLNILDRMIDDAPDHRHCGRHRHHHD